jgi:Flp pilus assembly pilin Flp
MLVNTYVRFHVLVGRLAERVRALAVSSLAGERGQTTSEYALVILAAAAVAVVLITWARSTGKLPSFFDNIIDQVAGSAG